MSKIGI